MRNNCEYMFTGGIEAIILWFGGQEVGLEDQDFGYLNVVSCLPVARSLSLLVVSMGSITSSD
jgi:hypothetical protein